MCSPRHLAPTWALVLLAGACSSGKSKDGGDGSTDARGANAIVDARLPDSRETPADRAQAADAAGLRDALVDARDAANGREVAGDTRDGSALRDQSGMEDGAEVGDAAKDARDAADARALSDLRDTSVNPDSPFAMNQDTAQDTAKDTVKDLAKDLAKDTTIDTRKVDAPTDAPPANSCATPIPIPMEAASADLVVTTTGESKKVEFSCGQGGPDVVLSFTVLQPELVYVDTFGTSWNTILAFSNTCPTEALKGNPAAGTTTCNDDACATTQSQIVGVFPVGIYYIFVSGANGESGDVTLHFQHTPIGNGPLVALPAGSATLTGTTNGEGAMNDVCEGPGPENSYWWLTCPDYIGGAFSASTCTGTSFDTILALQVPRTKIASCIDDSDPCGTRSSMKSTIPPGAGLNVLSIDGGSMSAFGAYQIIYTRP
jgi:hypothetical protein